jgi:hypothetical protein
MKKSIFWMYLTALLVLSLLPSGQLPSELFNVWDKLQHASGYALLSLLGLRAYPQRPVLQVAGFVLLVGALVELAQALTGWRAGEWTDMLANGTGVALALLGWRLSHRQAAARE